jgi:DNA-binding SARP family transcriptional activator
VHTISGVRRKTVLAVLAMQAGEVVSTDRLADIVWGQRIPRTASNTLQSHVSFLRRVIGTRGTISARSGGYLLDLGCEATDVAVAERLIRHGTQSADPVEVVRLLKDALALWRGSPLQDISGPGWTRDQAHRLGHLRLTAHKAQALARLALGQHTELTAELEPLTREHPMDEQLHEHLMLALYRGGRQSEALRLYDRLRSALRDQLGIDPGRGVRDLHTAILRQDDALHQAGHRAQ